jgi:hypothetical protein
MTQGRVIQPPLFLHNIPTWLGRHIYIYADTLHNISRLCRHSWTLGGIRLICRPGRYSYMPARPNLGQTLQSQPLSSYLSSLLTLPGVIPSTLWVFMKQQWSIEDLEGSMKHRHQDQEVCASKGMALIGFLFTSLKVVVERPSYRIDSRTIKRGFWSSNLITSS